MLADRIEELGDEIATLAAHIHAATHRLLVLIVEFDDLRGWEVSGHRDCADWLSSRTGIDRGAAQERVRAARALTELPLTSAAMALGQLAFSKVRALTRVAEPENEHEILDLAKGVTTAQLERMVRAWTKGDRQDEAARERARHASRTLSVFPDDDRVGHRRVRRREQPFPAVLEQLAHPALRARDDRQPRRPRLERRDPERLEHAHQHERVGAREPLADRRTLQVAGELDRVGDAETSGLRLHRATLRAVAERTRDRGEHVRPPAPPERDIEPAQQMAIDAQHGVERDHEREIEPIRGPGAGQRSGRADAGVEVDDVGLEGRSASRIAAPVQGEYVKPAPGRIGTSTRWTVTPGGTAADPV